MRTSGKIEMVATALEPIHHGAGTSGNTQLLRMQDIITKDGRHTRVPFISGNSFKHMIRESGARFACDAMGIEDGSLTKAITDLLFSGGALTKIGSSVNLENGRKLEQLFPLLSLCGYSAGNCMTQSKVRVGNIHLVCEENEQRIPPRVHGHIMATKRAALCIGEEFGTRHESSRRPHVAKMLTAGETHRLALDAEKPGKGDSAQMIYEFQVIHPGSVFWGSLILDDVTEMELSALKSALGTACEGVAQDGGMLFRLGAKASNGYGLVSIIFSGELRDPVTPPSFTSTTDLVPLKDSPTDVAKYATHLHEHKDEIVQLLNMVM